MLKAIRRSRLLITCGVVLAAAATGVLYLLRDPLPNFIERRSAILDISREPPSVIDASRLETVRLVATSGLVVNLAVRRQIGDSLRRLPVVVILGGHVTGAEAARLVGETPGLIIAAVSYPFNGDPRPSKATFLRQIPRIRAAFLDTPPALQLALDYILTRPDVDPSRVEAVGVSLGAPFVTIAGALDSRFTRVWAIHGSGGSYAPLEASMRRSIPFAPLRAISAAVASVIIAGPRLAPERWVSQISPRPFIMVNASEDERMPREAVNALFDGAAEPKEQIWMSGGHIRGDAQTIQRLVSIVLDRVSASSSD